MNSCADWVCPGATKLITVRKLSITVVPEPGTPPYCMFHFGLKGVRVAVDIRGGKVGVPVMCGNKGRFSVGTQGTNPRLEMVAVEVSVMPISGVTTSDLPKCRAIGG